MNKLINLIATLCFFIIPFVAIYLIRKIQPDETEEIILKITSMLTLIVLLFFPTDTRQD